MGRWMDGCKSCFNDCLKQSKVEYTSRNGLRIINDPHQAVGFTRISAIISLQKTKSSFIHFVILVRLKGFNPIDPTAQLEHYCESVFVLLVREVYSTYFQKIFYSFKSNYKSLSIWCSKYICQSRQSVSFCHVEILLW